MPTRIRSILFLGPPGAGKGTQGELVGAIPGLFHHSSGDAFRRLDDSVEPGKSTRPYMNRGDLVPDDLTIQVWRADLERCIAAGEFRPDVDLLLLDGIPRDVAQAELLDKEIEVRGVVHLFTSDEDAFVERLKKRALKEGRSDDANESTIRNRFEVYKRETQPVLDHYPVERIHTINALQTHAMVLRDVLSVVGPIHAEVAAGA